jgi:hypothetical protein
MPVPTVRLKSGSSFPTVAAPTSNQLFLPNNKLKPLCGLVDGKPRHHPEGVYHLRYMKRSKRVWERSHSHLAQHQ